MNLKGENTMKYHFAYGPNKVVAISSFAGKTVRGVAKCAPNDEFNKELGEELAVARCAAKIAEKRLKRAEMKLDEAHALLEMAQAYVDDMTDYHANAVDAFNESQFNLENLLSTL